MDIMASAKERSLTTDHKRKKKLFSQSPRIEVKFG